MGSSLSPLQHSYQHPMGYLDLLQFKLGLINYGSDVLLILAPAPTLRLFWIRLRLFSHSGSSSGSDKKGRSQAGSCSGSKTLPTT